MLNVSFYLEKIINQRTSVGLDKVPVTKPKTLINTEASQNKKICFVKFNQNHGQWHLHLIRHNCMIAEYDVMFQGKRIYSYFINMPDQN